MLSKAAARTTRKWVDFQKGRENFPFSEASRLDLGPTQSADGKFAEAWTWPHLQLDPRLRTVWRYTCTPNTFVCCFLLHCGPMRAMASSFLRFLDHAKRRITVGRTPLDEWSARHRDLYLTTHNTHNRQISMPPVGFEPTISASERPQNYALDRAATGTGNPSTYSC